MLVMFLLFLHCVGDSEWPPSAAFLQVPGSAPESLDETVEKKDWGSGGTGQSRCDSDPTGGFMKMELFRSFWMFSTWTISLRTHLNVHVLDQMRLQRLLLCPDFVRRHLWIWKCYLHQCGLIITIQKKNMLKHSRAYKTWKWVLSPKEFQWLFWEYEIEGQLLLAP